MSMRRLTVRRSPSVVKPCAGVAILLILSLLVQCVNSDAAPTAEAAEGTEQASQVSVGGEAANLDHADFSLLGQLQRDILTLSSQLNLALNTLTRVLGGSPSGAGHATASSGPGGPHSADSNSCPSGFGGSATGTPVGHTHGGARDAQVAIIDSHGEVGASSPSPSPHSPPPRSTPTIWPGNDPLYGDPGVGPLDPDTVYEFTQELPQLPYMTLGELRDARRARYMARETLAGAGVLLASQRLGVHPPTDSKTFMRQEAVRQAFKHAWKGYASYAWGWDQLKPVSKNGSVGVCNMGLTIVDSLDSIVLMDLPDQYFAAREWVRKELKFDHQGDVNVFETNIRVVGGLLGAYELTGDALFLNKSMELADVLLVAFNTPTGIPFGTINMKTRLASNLDMPGSSLSEVGTMQLEFQYLTFHSGDPRYANAADRAMRALQARPPVDGLYPMFIDPVTGLYVSSSVTLGARGDSLYEYLLKQFVQAGNRRHERMWIADMYSASVAGIFSRLLQYSDPTGYAYVAEQVKAAQPGVDMSPNLRHKVDHLTCFVPGMLALGAVNGVGLDFKACVRRFAKELADGDLLDRVTRSVAVEVAQGGGAGAGENSVTSRSPSAASSSSGADAGGPDAASAHTGVRAEAVDPQPEPAHQRPPPNVYTHVHDPASALTAALNVAVVELVSPLNMRAMLDIVSDETQRLIETADGLVHTCYQMYATTTSGLAPEIVTFKRGRDFKPNSDAAHSLLRPETVESLFVLYRLTGDEKYQDWGWDIFKAIERNARVESGGYSGLRNVNAVHPARASNKDDHMDSFFLSETLKYLFLLFSEKSLLPLNQYVFNTEAHPLKIFNYTH